MSHVCLGCGWELARVRALPEARYGLCLVTCPRCDASAVRRPDALVAAYRRWRGVRRSVLALARQGGLMVLFVLGLAGAIAGNVNELLDLRATPLDAVRAVLSADLNSRLRDWILNEGLFGFVLWGALAVAAGVWLTAGLRHLSRSVWLVWAAALLIVSNFEWVAYPMARAFGRAIGDPFTEPMPVDAVVESRLVIWACTIALAGLGIPLGRQWNALYARHQRHRAGRYRARRRRAHQGQMK